tara:strand:+ start:263 stop:1012 length:750 start_codon:yes stop_codon:yes gene_type:complete
MSINIDLSKKVTLITGGTRGIGQAISKVFLDAGAKVILTGQNLSQIKKLNQENTNPRIKWVFADFSTTNGITQFLDKLKETSDIDICINNAGINIIKPFLDYSDEEYDRLISINMNAPFKIIQHLIPSMTRNKFGRIINIASIWGKIAKSNRSLYTTSKAGLNGLTKSIAVEYAKNNILINTISPGFTKTKLTEESLSKNELNQISNQIPLLRFAETQEIAYIVLFFSSELNTYVTGQDIIIDGAFSIV